MDNPRPSNDPIASGFEAEALADDDSAARAMLGKGMPIHFRRLDTPKGLVIRRWPDGREEVIGADAEPLRRAS